ncbi:MAG: hypothetical protein U0Q47_11455 [Mycobacterium sp.]
MSVESVAQWFFSGIQSFEIGFIVLGVIWCLAMEGRRLTAKERYWRAERRHRAQKQGSLPGV